MSQFILNLMNRRFALLLMLMISSAAIAETSLEYEIGGADPISAPIYFRNSSRIAVGFDVSSRFSCGNFDFDASIRNVLSDARNRLRTQLVTAMRSMVAALPAIVLQRISPGLYDLFQNLMIRAEGDVRFATTSCQQIEQAALASDQPFTTLVSEAIQVDWGQAQESQSDDIDAAAEEINSNPGKAGIPYCDNNNRGGEGQDPIKPTHDASVIGYNTLLGRFCLDQSAPPNDPDQANPLTGTWSAPEDAAEWITETYGDVEMQLTEKAPKATTVGRGLNKRIAEDKRLISTVLSTSLANQGSTIPQQILDLMKTPSVPISRQLIAELSNLPAEQRNTLKQRLVAEVAFAQNIEKALMARKVLTASLGTPEVEGSEGMTEIIEKKIDRIDREVDDILRERQIRQQLVATTSIQTIRESYRQQSAGSSMIDTKDNGPQIGPGGQIGNPKKEDGS